MNVSESFISSPIESIFMDELTQRVLKEDFKVLKIKDRKINSSKLKNDFLETEKSYSFLGGRGKNSLRLISLQYSDPLRVFDDAIYRADNDKADVKNAQFLERAITLKNEISHKFSYVYEALPEIGMRRGRFFKLIPGGKVLKHSDGVNNIRLHIPIITAPKNYLFIDEQRFELSEEGGVYIVNTSRPHSVRNDSDIYRTHLIFEFYCNLNEFNWFYFLDNEVPYEERLLYHKVYDQALERDQGVCTFCHQNQSTKFVFLKKDLNLKSLHQLENIKTACVKCSHHKFSNPTQL